jgi:hypothetical protein
MKDLRGTYVRRGDIERRRRRVRAWFLTAGLGVAAVVGARNWEPNEARAEIAQPSIGERLGMAGTPGASEGGSPPLAGGQLERWHRIFTYSRSYRIPSDLAAAVYDASVSEGIDPDLAFPLVRLESEFNQHARSPAGAIGLTQLMLGTARAYVPDVTRDQLLERDLNLHVGFRYLHDLLREYRDIQIALLVYNRGPDAVALDRELGVDPSNGYDRIVLRGYRGTGLLDDD